MTATITQSVHPFLPLACVGVVVVDVVVVVVDDVVVVVVFVIVVVYLMENPFLVSRSSEMNFTSIELPLELVTFGISEPQSVFSNGAESLSPS